MKGCHAGVLVVLSIQKSIFFPFISLPVKFDSVWSNGGWESCASLRHSPYGLPLLSSSHFTPLIFHFLASSALQPTTSPFPHLPIMLAAAIPSLQFPTRWEVRLTSDFQHAFDITDHLFAFGWTFMAEKVSWVFMPRGRVDE